MQRWPSSVIRAVLAVAVLPLVGAACAGPRPDTAACVGVTDAVVGALSETLTIDGELRHARSVEASSGMWFVSAEFLPSDEDEDFPGDILTWATPTLEAPRFEAVDVNARAASTLAHSQLDVRAEGAVTSRGCVLPHRGEPVDPDCEVGFEEFCD